MMLTAIQRYNEIQCTEVETTFDGRFSITQPLRNTKTQN